MGGLKCKLKQKNSGLKKLRIFMARYLMKKFGFLVKISFESLSLIFFNKEFILQFIFRFHKLNFDYFYESIL
jgi:hypothetical protein